MIVLIDVHTVTYVVLEVVSDNWIPFTHLCSSDSQLYHLPYICSAIGASYSLAGEKGSHASPCMSVSNEAILTILVSILLFSEVLIRFQKFSK